MATKTRTTFKQSCTVSIDIDAGPSEVWALLTDAPGFPRWNTTVTSIDGTIALGARLQIKVPISPRTFKVKVTTFDAPNRLVWADGQAPMFRGVRTYVLEPRGGGTRFTMTETFAGLMLPMIRKTLPDFGPVFDQYAADLKREAEQVRARNP